MTLIIFENPLGGIRSAPVMNDSRFAREQGTDPFAACKIQM